MSIYDVSINRLDGSPADLHDLDDKAVLVVNVASQCGLTPQYTGLEELQERYGAQGFTVLGVPCNQFGAQEPGSAEAGLTPGHRGPGRRAVRGQRPRAARSTRPMSSRW
jgi:glutathione peroxidase-family protein